jgi:hypothetical protein
MRNGALRKLQLLGNYLMTIPVWCPGQDKRIALPLSIIGGVKGEQSINNTHLRCTAIRRRWAYHLTWGFPPLTSSVFLIAKLFWYNFSEEYLSCLCNLLKGKT